MTSATSPWHTRLRACARTFRELEPDEQSPQRCRGTEGNAHNLCIKCAWSFSKTRAIVAILRCMCSSRLVHLNRANTMFNWLCLGSSTTSVVFFVLILWPRICITTGVARLADEIIYCTHASLPCGSCATSRHWELLHATSLSCTSCHVITLPWDSSSSDRRLHS